MTYNSIVIHYSEISLKRGRRPLYERVLRANLERALGKRVKRLVGRMVLHLEEGDDYRKLCDRAGRVFGVAWLAPAIHLTGSIDELEKTITSALREENVRSFKIIVKRSVKTFPLTSIELAERLGRSISGALGIKVDLKNPEKKVRVEVTEDGFYVVFEKIAGVGGLPVGTSGRVLSLLSGGTDSAVAAWMMMKRGCKVDLLHIHPFLSHEEVLGSKIEKIARLLSEYGLGLKLYLASFRPFFLKSFELPPRMILVAFRAYILRVADRMARSRGYLGIATGDSIGQVASQTLENLYAVSGFSQTPVYRPLIGMDKQEIIEMAKKIGTYTYSIEEYRDCCTIIARHPETRADPADLRDLWEKFELESAVDQTLEDVAEYEF